MALKAILAGLGGRGFHWFEQCRKHAGTEVVAAVEPNAERRALAIKQFGLKESQLFNSLEEAIKGAKADFVLDVTPPAVHRKVAEAAFKAGLHVLGEKPLSDNMTDARAVVKAGEKAGLKHMITQNYRFSAPPRTTRKLIEHNAIGAIGQCDVRFYRPWADHPGSHYVTEPYMFINDMMVHHFDMMRYVLGLNPLNVVAHTWNHSWGWHKGDAAHAIVFEFEGGVHGTHTAVGCEVGEQTNWNGDWFISGSKGSITWTLDAIRRQYLHKANPQVREEVTPLAVPDVSQAILDEFAAAIAEDREPECSSADNVHSLAMALAAIRSAKEGRKVRIDEM